MTNPSMTNVVEISREDGIAVLSFSREARLNALTTELARAIVASLAGLDGEEGVRGIVLTGAGSRAFCAGVDLEEARSVRPDEVEAWFGAVCAVYRQILATTKPVVAAVNGVATGAGFQIALVSDLRVAHAGARLGQPEINAGIPSIMGAHWMRLHLGWSKNQELSLTGRMMDGAEAERLGLVNHLVAAEAVVAKAREAAAGLAAKPAVAWAHTKARFRAVAMEGFDEAFRAAVEGQREAYARGEPQAIMEGFLRKRAARDTPS